MTENELVERLAESTHNAWVSWMQWMFEHGRRRDTCVPGDGWVMNADKYQRWQRQANTPYAELSEEEKESDRKVAHEHFEWLISMMTSEQVERPPDTTRRARTDGA